MTFEPTLPKRMLRAPRMPGLTGLGAAAPAHWTPGASGSRSGGSHCADGACYCTTEACPYVDCSCPGTATRPGIVLQDCDVCNPHAEKAKLPSVMSTLQIGYSEAKFLPYSQCGVFEGRYVAGALSVVLWDRYDTVTRDSYIWGYSKSGGPTQGWRFFGRRLPTGSPNFVDVVNNRVAYGYALTPPVARAGSRNRLWCAIFELGTDGVLQVQLIACSAQERGHNDWWTSQLKSCAAKRCQILSQMTLTPAGGPLKERLDAVAATSAAAYAEQEAKKAEAACLAAGKTAVECFAAYQNTRTNAEVDYKRQQSTTPTVTIESTVGAETTAFWTWPKLAALGGGLVLAGGAAYLALRRKDSR